MRTARQAGAALAIGFLAACGPHATADATRPAPPEPPAAAAATGQLVHGFPLHASMQPLCAGSVVGADGTEIVWSIYVSDVPPEDLARFYAAEVPGAAFQQSATEWTWLLPNADAPDHVLSLAAPAAAFVPHDCGHEVPATARTVGNFSAMHGRH